MKKVTTFAMGLVALMSVGTAMAETKTITSKSEFTTAIAAARTADGVDTLYIKPASDNTLSIGSIKNSAGVTCEKGTLVIIGVNDETTGERPIIMTDWQFSDNEEADNFSLIIENCNLQYRSGASATSGQIFYANKKAVFFKEFTLRNCEITNYARTIIRTIPTDADTDGKINYGAFEHFEISDCDIHYANITSGNTWACIVMGSPMVECVLTGNVFYDLPYNKQIMSMSYINLDQVELDNAVVTIENNAFLTATQQTNPLFDFNAYLGQMATLSIQNNLFLRPTWENEYNLAVPTTTDDETGIESVKKGQILRSSYGMLTIKGNVVDEYYKESDGDWTRDQYYDADGEGAWLDAATDPAILPSAVELTWSDFAAADAGDFSIYKGHALYTAGVDGAPVGPSRLYTDVLKVKAAVSITTEGSKSAEVTLVPAKDQYFAGDVIVATIDTKGDLNEFLGWSDGSMETERTITVEGDVNLVAKFKEVNYIAVWNLDELASVNNKKYDAPLAPNYATEEGYTLGYKTFNGEAYVDSITSAFQTRNNKLSNDVIRYCTFLHSTKNQIDTLKKSDYIYLNVQASSNPSALTAYVGTDNYSSSIINVDYSLDGETWTNLSKTQIVEVGKWAALKAEIPAELAGKAYTLRIQGDVEAERVAHEDIDPATAAYEFVFIADVRLLGSDSESAISVVNADKAVRNANAPVFDLMGRRVVKTQAGKLYIQNGVKFIEK